MARTIKILLTDSYGAGWSTWARNDEVAEYILTYLPIIDYIEAKEAADEGHDLDENHPLVKKMLEDITAKFGAESLPYVGGAKNLRVEEVHSKSLIESLNIKDYDGKESLGYY